MCLEEIWNAVYSFYFVYIIVIIILMNDLRLLLQADKDRKIINLEFKYMKVHSGKSTIWVL